jgi:hypothetical protein
MTEAQFRRDLAAAAEHAIPSDSHLATDVVSLAAARPRGRRWPQPRLRLALFGAVALAAVTAAGALAVASGTLPVQFNLIDPGPVHTSGQTTKPGAIDMPSLDPVQQAQLAAKKAKAAEDEAQQGPAGGGTNVAPTKNAADVRSTTLADAEAAFGTRVLVAPGATPVGVTYESAASQGTGSKPGAPTPKDTVQLKYSIDGSAVTIAEERDDTTTPLTVDVLNVDGPAMKTEQGLGPAAIETVAGGSYVVGYTVDHANVAWVVFKSTSGVDVWVHFDPGISHEAALAFATSLQ